MFNEIDASSLIHAWPKIKNYPFDSNEIRIDDKKHPICAKDSDVYAFFSYIKLISTHRVNFDRAVKPFVLYSNVSYAIQLLMQTSINIFKFILESN